VFLVPIPSHTQAEGVVWLSDQSLVRAGVNGFVREVLVPPGTSVKAGDALVRCSNPTVETDLRVARARVTELEATLASEVQADRTRGGLARAKLDQERHNLAIAEERAAELITRAKTDGVFVVPLYEDMTDRYYHKGDLFAYVIGSTDQLVRVVVPQDAIDRVRVNTDRIRLRSVDHPETSLVGHIIRAVPGGDEMLPSRALGAEGGGEIATDPRDNRGIKALRRMFQFDVGVDAAWPNKHFGQRVYVRFEHEGEPLSAQWYRTIRLLFLSRFSV
jgi:putative peptide zinc metalloprotease protein